MARNSSTFNVAVKLATNQFTKGIESIRRQIQGLSGFVKGAFALGSVVAFGKQMIQVSSEFEDAMARVQAVSNASVQGFKMMAQEAKHLGETTKYTATEAAQALENLTRNGLTAQQATNSLASVLKLAQANAIGLAESATILTNTMNMFGLTTKDTTKITDVLSATAANSATNITQLFEALTNAAPTAKNLGISINEVAAALGSMAQRGVKGAEAGTQLRMALTKMVDPKIVAKMQAMNIEISEQQIRNEGLLKTIERLKNANLELGDLVKIFSQRGAQGMAQLIASYNDFDILTKVLADSEGETSRMFQQGLGSTKKAALELKSAFQQLLITIGENTRGPFNEILRFLKDVVKNMYTWEGRLKNLAAVGIPILTNALAQFLLKFKLTMAQAVTAAEKAIVKIATLRTVIGGVITTVVTLASVIGVNLLMKLERTDKEIEGLIEDLAGTEKETAKLTNRVQELIEKLDGGGSLNDVVLEACRLFPDFRDRILEASRAADDTEPYDKLKAVLKDILELQAAVAANAVLNKLADAYVTKLSEEMQKTFGDPMASRFYKGIKEAVGKEGRGQIDAIYYAIADAIGRSSSLEHATDAVKEVLKRTGIEMDNALTEAMVSYYYMTDAADKAYETFSKIGANDDLLKEDEEKRRKIKEDEIKAAEEAKKKEEAAAAAASKRKDAAEKLKEIDEKYNQEIANAEDDLLNGYLSFSEYTKKLAEAAKKAYESLRDETGAKGSDNKYYDTRRQAEHDAALTTKISGKGIPSVTGKAEVMGKKALEQSDGIKIKVHPIIDMEEYKTSWKDVFTDVDTIEGMVTTFENLGQALNTVENSFETLGDSNKSFIEKFQALTKIFGGIYDAINNLISMYELLGDSELAMLIKEKLAVGVKKKLKREEVVANKANAISGAAAAMASIPYVGPVLAAAAAESLAALLEATVPKFAKGGIIQGGSKYGDKLLARVNAGEAVLTQAQQKRFMDMANGKYSGGGQVSFHISGKDLVGVIRNNNAATSRISGQKGF